jgi:hypothetical protein
MFDPLSAQILAQTVDDGSKFLREFGVPVVMARGMTVAFVYGVWKLREDMRVDRDRLLKLIDEQRAAFVAVLTETRVEHRQAQQEQAKAFQDVLTRIEVYWQRTTAEICGRLQKLTEEIQAIRGGGSKTDTHHRPERKDQP